MDVDTPAVRALRQHLLRLSTDSIPPSLGFTRAREQTPEEDEVLRRFAPFAELLYLVAASDGRTVKAEREVILGAFRALTGGRVRSQRLSELEASLRERMATSGPDEMLEEVASSLALVPQDAELGFALSAAVVLADSSVEAREERFLVELADWLGIGSERARGLLRGMLPGAAT